MSRKKTAGDAHVSGGINQTDRPYLSAPTLRGVCRAVGFGTKRVAPVAGFHRALPSTTRDKAIYFLQMHPTIIPGGCQGQPGRKSAFFRRGKGKCCSESKSAFRCFWRQSEEILKPSSGISHLCGFSVTAPVWYNDQENPWDPWRGVGTQKKRVWRFFPCGAGMGTVYCMP